MLRSDEQGHPPSAGFVRAIPGPRAQQRQRIASLISTLTHLSLATRTALEPHARASSLPYRQREKLIPSHTHATCTSLFRPRSHGTSFILDQPTQSTSLSRAPSSFCVPQVSQRAGQLTTALPFEPTYYWPLNLPCGAGWWWSASNSCVASCHCPATRTACTANSPFHLRQALASIQAVRRMSLFPRCRFLRAQDAG